MAEEMEHPRREEPRRGCCCSGCRYAREEHIEEELRNLWHEEHRPSGGRLALAIPFVSQIMQFYLHGDVGYEEAKTELIKRLWEDNRRMRSELTKVAMMKPLILEAGKTAR